MHGMCMQRCRASSGNKQFGLIIVHRKVHITTAQGGDFCTKYHRSVLIMEVMKDHVFAHSNNKKDCLRGAAYQH